MALGMVYRLGCSYRSVGRNQVGGGLALVVVSAWGLICVPIFQEDRDPYGIQ